MFEVKGRASVFWYWSGAGVVLGLLGWVTWDWLWGGGILLLMFPASLFASAVVFVTVGIWKALDKRPAMVVNEKGVLDRTSMPSRLLSWADVEDFRLVVSKRRQPVLLAVDLVDPERFIDKAMIGSAGMLEEFQKEHGTPCVIALKALEIEPHNLLERLKSAMRQHKR